MAKRIVAFFLIVLFSLAITGASSAFAFSSRSQAIAAALDRLELSNADMSEEDYTPQFSDSSQAVKKEKEYWVLDWSPEQRFLINLGLGLQTGYITGDSTYRISFSGGASELEFPVDNALLGVVVVLHIKGKEGEEIKQDRDKTRFNIEWVTSISDKAGKVKDSDWLDGDGHPGLDIYSESDAELDFNAVDLNFIYNFWPTENITIGPMLGYKYQKLEYGIYNLNQVGYGPYHPMYTSFVSGKVGDYEVKYSIPYLGLDNHILLGDKFQLNLEFGYSPWAEAEDIDDHILRYKLSTADCDGDAYFLGLGANWKFLSDWLLQIGGKYVDIDTAGIQHQEFYAGPHMGTTYDVDDKITSSYWIASAKFEYVF